MINLRMRPQDSTVKSPGKTFIRDYILLLGLAIAILNSILFQLLNVQLINIRTPTFIDLIFVGFTVFSIRKINLGYFILSLLMIIYASLVITLSYANNVPLYEAIRATKWMYYLALIIFVQNGLPVSNRFFSNLVRFSMIICFLKYLLDKILFGLTYRPFLIYENNYELLFLSVLYIGFLYEHRRDDLRTTNFYTFLFLMISFMSLSRWAVVSSCIILVVMNFNNKSAKSKLIKIIFVFSSLVFLVLTFALRTQSFKEIDRYKFLAILFRELRSDSLIEWLIKPNLILKSLSSDSCTSLKFYQQLFANADNNSCYSVILHSFIFRILFDFGPIILAILLTFFFIMFKARFDSKVALLSLMILILNGLSVSSINTGFGALPFAIIILTQSTWTKDSMS
jgi:hypothetical protein